MPKKRILFISGVADLPEIYVSSIDETGNHTFHYEGNSNLSRYLSASSFEKAILNLDATQDQEIVLPPVDAIFNQVSNTDTHQIALSKVENLDRNLSGKIPLFNTPSNIRKISKETLFTLLKDIDKLQIPKTLRIHPHSPNDIYDAVKEGDFHFPVILKKVHRDSHSSPFLIINEKEAFHSLALDGSSYYITQFIDYHLNGFYRKERLAVVDGEVFIANVQFGEQWVINSKNQLSAPEEILIMKESIAKRFESKIKPKIQPIITEIYQKLGLDYFVIDCHIDENQNIILFNLTPEIDIFNISKKDIFANHIMKIHQKITQMLEKEIKEREKYV